ncbi:hypothetical protein [Phenylobacterium sp.]|uniref:hypothetical protein n=1 Tax=Phenylobacterium sp. TaxID=1871053 RepID=UPI002B653BDA|nr:hypothetical protein [Phenylobacterium sp.]HVI30605.1 hypothetical protein [Phenylobacterium sp.]
MDELSARDEDLKLIHVSLVLGHRPAYPDAHFDELTLNGQPVTIWSEAQFPGQQGIIIALGWHEPKATLNLSWRFRIPFNGEGVYLVGCYLDRGISKMKRLQLYEDVMPGQVCEGTASFTLP